MGSGDGAERLRRFVDAVWAQEPPDVRRLRDTHLPPAGRWGGTLFANLLLLWSGQNLHMLRTLAREGRVPVDALSAVAGAYLRQLSVWLAHWHMDDTCGLADALAGAFEANEFRTAEEFGDAAARLSLALNRVQNWIDAYTPWAQLDARLPALSADNAPGQARCR